jgi:hypothetical protein
MITEILLFQLIFNHNYQAHYLLIPAPTPA